MTLPRAASTRVGGGEFRLFNHHDNHTPTPRAIVFLESEDVRPFPVRMPYLSISYPSIAWQTQAQIYFIQALDSRAFRPLDRLNGPNRSMSRACKHASNTDHALPLYEDSLIC